MFENINFEPVMDEFDNFSKIHLTIHDKDDILNLLYRPELMPILVKGLGYDLSKFDNIIITMNDIYFNVSLHSRKMTVFEYTPETKIEGYDENDELYQITYDGTLIKSIYSDYKSHIDDIISEKLRHHEACVDFYYSLKNPTQKRVN